MKFHVYRNLKTGQWWFTNYQSIAGACATWREAFDEAFDLATIGRPLSEPTA